MKTEEERSKEDYERFKNFWEKAREITDEDGNKIIKWKWDNSLIAQFCFTRGYTKAKAKVIEDVLKMIEEEKQRNQALGFSFEIDKCLERLESKLKQIREEQ